jgi:hypothetical protein
VLKGKTPKEEKKKCEQAQKYIHIYKYIRGVASLPSVTSLGGG